MMYTLTSWLKPSRTFLIPYSGEGDDPPADPPTDPPADKGKKSFTQKQVDGIIAKRLEEWNVELKK